jgi:hypothetical protein
MLGYNFSRLATGKRGEKPPLPRNCNRLEAEQASHWETGKAFNLDEA